MNFRYTNRCNKIKMIRGGHNKETIMLTINTFKKFCMKASTKRAEQICDYYLKMENIMHKYTKAKLDENKQLLMAKDNELKLLLESKKHTTDKKGIVYIACNLKEANRNIYKVGKALNDKREYSMNTYESDRCFKILRKFNTSNRDLAEKLIHTHNHYMVLSFLTFIFNSIII